MKDIEEVNGQLDALQKQIDQVVGERYKVENKLLDVAKGDDWEDALPIIGKELHLIHVRLLKLGDRRRELKAQKRELTPVTHCECCENNIDLVS